MGKEFLYVKIDGEVHGKLTLEDAAELIACAPPDARIGVTTCLGTAWVPPTEIPGLVRGRGVGGNGDDFIDLCFGPPDSVVGLDETRLETGRCPAHEPVDETIPSLVIPLSELPVLKPGHRPFAPNTIRGAEHPKPRPLTDVKVDLGNLAAAGIKEPPLWRSPLQKIRARGSRRRAVRPMPRFQPRARGAVTVRAGRGARLLALLSDLALFFLPYLLHLEGHLSRFAMIATYGALGILTTGLLFLRGQTPGKWACDLAIVDAARPYRTPFVRLVLFSYFLWVLALGLLFLREKYPAQDQLLLLLCACTLLSDLLPALGTSRRRFSERLAGTRVIRAPRSFGHRRFGAFGLPAAPPVPLPILCIALAGILIWLQRPILDLQRGLSAGSMELQRVQQLNSLNRAVQALGPAHAPVHVVEFGDFADPRSRVQHARTKALLVRYENNIRYTFHALPMDVRPESHGSVAARALTCAAAQGRRYVMKDLLFRYGANLSETAFNSMANAARLNRNQFRACMARESTQAGVRFFVSTARKLGVTEVPAFFVNGRRVEADGTRELHALLERSVAEKFSRTRGPGEK